MKISYILRLMPALVAGLIPLCAGASAPPEAGSVESRITSRSDLRALVERLSLQEGLDPLLVDALVIAESGYNPKALSKKGAMGLMQLMPQTARRLNVDDPFDPEQNVRGGVQEFSRLISRYSGNLSLALAAYNAGEGAVSRYSGIPPYSETRNYVSKIMESYTGRPYRFGSYRMKRSPVRLHGSLGSGTALISNVGKSSGVSIAPGQAGSLSGGFGK